MSLATTLSCGAVATLVAIFFVLGAAPVFAVRLIGLLYPRGHARRVELIAEMAHIRGIAKLPEQWCWLGETFAVAICEGVPLRLAAMLSRVVPRLCIRIRLHISDSARLVTPDGGGPELRTMEAHLVLSKQVLRRGRWVDVPATAEDLDRISARRRRKVMERLPPRTS